MRNSEFSKFNMYNYLVIIILKCDLTLLAGRGEIASVEKSLNEYYTYVDKFERKWLTPLITCDRLKFNSHFTDTHTPTVHIMLESQNCTRIKMKLLICIRNERSPLHTPENPSLETTKGVDVGVRGVHGEVYRVEPPYHSTKCKDPQTPVIKGCIHDGKNMRVDLSEIEELFLKNHEFFSSQKWANPRSTCELACPEMFGVVDQTIERLNILLKQVESNEYENIHIQMYILKCSCQHKELMSSKIILLCAQGIHGEVYKVSPTDKGNIPEDFYIRKRIIDFEGKRVVLLCPPIENLSQLVVNI